MSDDGERPVESMDVEVWVRTVQRRRVLQLLVVPSLSDEESPTPGNEVLVRPLVMRMMTDYFAPGLSERFLLLRYSRLGHVFFA